MIAASAFIHVIRPSSASAQSKFEAHGIIDGNSDYGVGGRINIMLSRKGFISSINDNVALSVGGDVMFREGKGGGGKANKKKAKNGGDGLASVTSWDPIFPVAAQWNLNVGKKFTIFPELGMEVYNFDDPTFGMYYAAGVRYRFKARMALTARLTHRRMFNLGLAF